MGGMLSEKLPVFILPHLVFSSGLLKKRDKHL